MRMGFIVSAALLVTGVSLATLPHSVAAAGTDATAVAVRDGSHDFDFLYGKWKIHNRLLEKQPDGSKVWKEFDSTNDCYPLQAGFGNNDYYRTEYWKGFVGMSIRLYDREKGLWSIYWAENDEPGVIQVPPVVGKFEGNIGTFVNSHDNGAASYMVRYIWTVRSKDSAQWEHAVSRDAGKTWETDWTMDFKRG